MPTALYVSANPIDRLTMGMNNKDDQQGVLELGKKGNFLQSIPCTVMEIIGKGLYIKPDLSNTETLRGKGEDATRALLKDTHRTFELLMHGLSVASDYLKQGRQVSLDLYKKDISHPDFVEGIKSATNGKEHAESLTLEIRGDQYGSLGNNTINKLGEVCTLGVGVGIEDFHEGVGGEIDIDNTIRIVRGGIKPKYIKISNIVINRIKHNNVTKSVANLYAGLIKMGIHIVEYFGGSIKKESTINNTKSVMADTLINSANIEYEPMLTFSGEAWVEELLVRFDNGLRTDIGLDQLKELGCTQDLVIKMLGAAVKKAKQGKRVSINLYIKDLGSENLMSLIKKIAQDLPREYRKNIIFEILEERYGIINTQFIKHVDRIQKEGFSLAIDDLYVSELNNGMSLEILDELLEAGVYPDMIKLDGKHSMAIRDDSITAVDVGKIITLIGQFAIQKPITIVAEWIQDMEHAKKIRNLFSSIKGEINIIYQGREINTGNFGEKNEGLIKV